MLVWAALPSALCDGLLTGLNLALAAVALTMVYLPTRVFYVGLAGIYAAVPFIAWAGATRGWPPLAVIALALASGVLLSELCEWLNHRPLERRRASSGAHLVSSLGLAIVITETLVLVGGSEPRNLPFRPLGMVPVGSLALPARQLVGAAFVSTVLVGFYLWLRHTTLGLRFRALAENPELVALFGHDVVRLRTWAFGVSGLLIAVAALASALDVGFEPYDGLPVLMLAVGALVLGGRGSFIAPALGGLAIGVLRAAVVWMASERWQDAATYGLLVVMLIARPQGLLGRQARLEATS